MFANLDLVRSIYADWERGDFERTDWADPEIEFLTVGGANAQRTGVAAMQDAGNDWIASFTNYRLVADRVIASDDQRVLALTHADGEGLSSGVTLALAGTPLACLFELSDGKVTRFVVYFDRDRALADLGLEE